MQKRNKYFLIIIIILVIISHWYWFFERGPFTEGDWWFFYPETLKEFFTLAYSWHSIFSMGGNFIGNGFYPQFATYGLFAHLFNFSTSQSDLFIYFYALIFVSAISSYYLVRFLTNSSTAGFVGSLVFSYNTYFLLVQNGHETVAMANALTPLVILCFIKTLEETSLRYSIITGIVLAVLSQYEVRISYIVGGIIIFYLLYDIAVKRENSLKKVGTTILIFIILVLSNLYWLLELFISSSPQHTAVLHRGLFGDFLYTLRHAFITMHPSWTGDVPGSFSVEPIPVRFWLIPILAFIVLFFKKVDRKIVFFSMLALIGIFFTKQSAAPFHGVYRWLYYHFPGFGAFREASKFYLIINLSYAVLIGYSVSKIYLFVKDHVRVKYIGEIFVSFVAFLYLWNTYPFITQKLGLTMPKTIPHEYIEFKNNLLTKENFFRSMGVLRSYRYSCATSTHPHLNSFMIKHELWKKADLPEFNMINTFKYPHLNWLFDTAAIKYVYIPYDSENEVFDYFDDRGSLKRGFGGNRNDLEKTLDNLRWLTNKTYFGKIVVYENKNYMPHIYTSGQH